MPELDITAFVTEPPEFRIEDGLVHIVQRFNGRFQIERVMRYHLFLKTIALAQKTVREYEARGVAEVIDFPKKANAPH